MEKLGICWKLAHWVWPLHSPQGFVLEHKFCDSALALPSLYRGTETTVCQYVFSFGLLLFVVYDLLTSMSETFRNHSSQRQTRGTVDRDWATVAKAAQDTPASIQTSSCRFKRSVAQSGNHRQEYKMKSCQTNPKFWSGAFLLNQLLF